MKQKRKPQYLRIADELQSAIEQGYFPVGSLLPTELELCDRYAISRHTARAALARLSAAGLVSRRPRHGTRVIARRPAMHYACEFDTVEQLLQYGNATRMQILTAKRRRARGGMAQQLAIPPGSEFLHLTAKRLEDLQRESVALTEMRIPIHDDTPVRALLDPACVVGTLNRMMELGRLSVVEQEFDVTVLGAEEAEQLGVGAGEPAMRAQRRYLDAHGRLQMLATSLHPRDRFTYRAVLSRDAR